MSRKRCDSCMYWSEMLAMCDGGGPLQAVCLKSGGKHHGKYVSEWNLCDKWEDRINGAVDDPSLLYEQEGVL